MTPLEDNTAYRVSFGKYPFDKFHFDGYLYLFSHRGKMKIVFFDDQFPREGDIDNDDKSLWIEGIQSFYKTGRDRGGGAVKAYQYEYRYEQLPLESFLTHSNPHVRSFIRDRIGGKVLDLTLWGDRDELPSS